MTANSQRPHDRRTLLKAALAVAATAVLPAAPAATPAGEAAASPAARRFDALMDDAVDQILRMAPDYATVFGLDNGARADLKSRLGTVSNEEDARADAMVRALSARLAGIDRTALDARRRTLYDTVRVHVDDGLAGTAFPVIGGGWSGFMGGASPYVISQMGSAMTSVPTMLDTQHRIDGRADAEAYLARLAMLGPLLDAESARLNEQAALGMLPPDFILRTALGQLRNILALPVAKQTLVTSIAARTRAKRIGGDWEGRARRIVANDVYPALRRQIAAVDRALAQATGAPGVDRLPNGAAYYRWALKVSTTTDMGPDDIHRLGIEQGRELESRMDAVLRAQGRTEGTVGARMLALATDPAFLYPDDEGGRERLIADCNARIAALRTLLPRISHLGLKAPLTIRRVPAEAQDGAPLGYLDPAPLDGSRPAAYYINLKSTRLWPRYILPSLSAHEGIPGHALQTAYGVERGADWSTMRTLMASGAFSEGWALYAEQVVDELGLYDDDPYARLGYLQEQRLRVCRLVVDTGLHHKGWTRQQAIDTMMASTGYDLAASTSEVDRYVVIPGQACSYKIGHNAILRERERARAALGARFDLAGFNDALISSMSIPMTLLPGLVDAYIAEAQRS